MAEIGGIEQKIYVDSSEIHPRQWEELGDRPYEDSAKASKCLWDGEKFTLHLLGRDIVVNPATQKFSWKDAPGAPVDFQSALVAISYIAGAMDADPSGNWISFREIPGGAGFFRGPHSIATEKLERRFGDKPTEVIEAAKALGGAWHAGGDAAASFPALPNIPLMAIVWGTEGQLSASATLLTDKRAVLHLQLDVLWALTNIAIRALTR